MNAYCCYMIGQSERPRTPAEQRAADVRMGELAASFAQFRHSLWAPVRAFRRVLQQSGDKLVGAGSVTMRDNWEAGEIG